MTFKVILKFLYCGVVDLEDLEDEAILELLIAADELLIQRLIDFIQEFLIKDNPKEFVPEVWAYKDLLPDNLIEDVIRCYLDSDVRPMYNTFLIRWGNLEIDSVLINKEIALILTKWIDKTNIDDDISKGSKYKFNRLFRSSLDGLSSQMFHRFCDNQGATIVIAKIKNTTLLIGGYNPLDWNGTDEWKQTMDSFLFVLDFKDIRKGVVSRINHSHSKYAVFCDSNCGPSFGEGPDFHILNNSYTLKYKAKSYSKMVNSHTLLILDYEVFQVESIAKPSIQDQS
ncbi:8413_t:CDS:2 [Cetraspora pellucida]|uniref:8413_t:CDS:1 n=1 Tax=Cetraspora pellucida TaxID=1433469 RepID=A0ACA9L0X6_9GLOM|nr:8413_t:CDS:2 [Cetraspora pellucida]